MMETSIELMVMIGVGVILLGIVSLFVYQWNIQKDAENMLERFAADPEKISYKTDSDGFARHLHTAWLNCTSNASFETSFYVDGNETVNKTWLFNRFKSLGWCKTIQSASEGCGNREDINMTYIQLPAVISARCMNTTMVVD
jgi:hypothetical protein